jgi:hypothetical protein
MTMVKDLRPEYRYELCLVDGDFSHVTRHHATSHSAMHDMERFTRQGVYLQHDKDDFTAWTYIPANRIIKVTMRGIK